jgi:hypothetical protein
MPHLSGTGVIFLNLRPPDARDYKIGKNRGSRIKAGRIKAGRIFSSFGKL